MKQGKSKNLNAPTTLKGEPGAFSFFLSLLHIIKKQKGKRNNGFFKIYQFKYGS